MVVGGKSTTRVRVVLRTARGLPFPAHFAGDVGGGRGAAFTADDENNKQTEPEV